MVNNADLSMRAHSATILDHILGGVTRGKIDSLSWVGTAMTHKMLTLKAGIDLVLGSYPLPYQESIPQSKLIFARNRFYGIDAWGP
jgi:hypothetical protein